jgi:multidrug efflux pump subunit AcrB
MRRLSAWAITHPVFPLVLFAVLTVFGIVAFARLPITLNPDISAPFVRVTVSEPGAAPAEIETQILQKVEGAVANVGNVKNITSWAIEGVAQTVIEFQIGTPVDRATSDVRDAVARVRAELPQGILEPQVRREDVDGGPIVYYAISATDMSEEQLSWFVDDTITKRLLATAGVAQITRSGGVSREIRVDLDPARMESYGITAGEVNQQLRLVNVNAAGGRAQVGGSEQSIRVLGGAGSAYELGEVRLTMPDGRVARLNEIADVRDGTEEVRTISRLNGRPATTFGVFKAKGASDVTTLHRIEAELDKFRTVNTWNHTQAGVHDRRFHAGIVSLVDRSADRGGVARRGHRVGFPARLARDRHLGYRDTAGGAANLRLHAMARLYAQSNDLAGTVADHWRARRRCDRGSREHHASHAHGQERLPGRHGCGR